MDGNQNKFWPLTLSIAMMLTATAASAVEENFDALKPGMLPDDWTCGVTGKGSPVWKVETDTSAPSKPNVLKQSGSGTFPWCVKQSARITDGFVEVKFKPLAGREDQAGGLVWRFKDGDTYYIARANALENNVTIYHTIKGKRTEKKRTNMNVASGQWHTIRVDFNGNHFTVTFDGKKAIEWNDDTFQNAGKVGVWTKADSVTSFDHLTYGSK